MVSKLKFDKNIMTLKSKDQIRALQSLHQELSRIEQESMSLSSLDNIKSQLISSSLLSSKDSGVRAFLSCCLADILRLYAPDAPFDQTDLSQIFQLFISEIRKVSNTGSTYFKQYLYLLEDIVQVQCIALVAELPDKEHLIDQIFKNGYFLLQDDKSASSTEYLITTLLSQLVQEVETLSFDTIRLILEQFLKSSSSSCYKTSKLLCSEHTNAMIRMTHFYFSEIFSQFHGLTDEEIQSNGQMQTELDAINNILVEIWRAQPQILNNVMKQLEQYMMQEIVNVRSALVLTIGQILQINGSVNFVNEFSSIYSAWLSRVNDKDPQVRSTWASCAGPILVKNTDTLRDVVFGLEQLLQDPDEQVRLETCNSMALIESIDIYANKILPVKNLVGSLCERLRDKKAHVRTAASELLTNIFDMACTSALNGLLPKEFAEIPSKFIELTYINDLEINEYVDVLFFTKILPDTILEDADRTRRLLTVCNNLSESSLKILEMMCERQKVLCKALMLLLQVIEDESQDDFAKQSKINSYISWLCKQLSHPEKARNALIWFAEPGRKNLHEFMKTCIDSQSNCSEVFTSLHSLRLELERGNKQSVFEVLRILLYRGGYFLFNRSFIEETLKIAFDAENPLSGTAKHYIEFTGHYQPEILCHFIERSNGWLLTDSFEEPVKSDILELLQVVFQTCSDKMDAPSEFWKSIERTARGDSLVNAGLAVRLLKFAPDGTATLNGLCTDSLRAISEGVQASNELVGKCLSSSLSVLVELYELIPSVIEEDAGNLTMSLVSDNILMKKETAGTVQSDKNFCWGNLDSMDEFYSSKVLVLRLLTARLIAAKEDKENAKLMLSPMLKLLHHFSQYGIENAENEVKASIRFETGLSLIRLYKELVYDELINSKDFQLLVNLTGDPCEKLRAQLIDEIISNLKENQLNESKFFVISLFVTKDPSDKIKSFGSTWIRAKYEREKTRFRNSMFIERCLARFIVHLTHKTANLETAADYLLHFLSLLADESNICSLSHVASKMIHFDDKIAKDIKQPDSTAMYQISQVAQICITSFRNHKSWKTVPFSGRIDLPGDVLAKSSSKNDSLNNSSLLNEEQVTNIQEFVAKQLKKSGKKSSEINVKRIGVKEIKNFNGKSRSASVYDDESSSDDIDNDDDDDYKVSSHKKMRISLNQTRRSARNKNIVSYAADE